MSHDAVALATGAPLATGFHRFHPDVSINYQLNRFSDGSPQSVVELTAAAGRIFDYLDYIGELLGLSEDADASGRPLAGALYQRSAEFYMLPTDPRKDASRRRFVGAMRTIYGVDGATRDLIPYGAGHLYAHRITPSGARGTVVMFGGFDSYLEELFATQRHFVAAGYDVVVFEGPGQGSVLEETHLAMTPAWGPVVGAILDHYDLAEVTVMGYSLGGGLAIRAAATEPRIRRVICDDILTDFRAVTLHQLRPATRRLLTALLALRAKGAVNQLTAAAMRGSLVADWGLRQGQHTTGTSSAYDFLRGTARYETASVSGRVDQDVLLLAGSNDHYVPRSQLAQQLGWLTSARSVTARLFTAAEEADNHVHVGNTELALRVMTEWLASLDLRDQVPGPR